MYSSDVIKEDVWGTYDTIEAAKEQALIYNQNVESYPSANDYELALGSQTACNLTAIVRSLAQVSEEIWAEARRKSMGTDYVNAHPICRLYAEQISYLSTKNFESDSPTHDSWMKAIEFCERMSGHGNI
jgi:hypothetical protein